MNTQISKDSNNQLDVGKLIKSLNQFSKSSKVVLQGCDCYGDACGVEKGVNDTVIITRQEEV